MAEDTSETLVYLYQNDRVTILHSVTLIFSAVVTLKSRVVLPCFSFPVQLTQSVYTQHGRKQTSTECYCRLRRVSDIQRKVSTGGQLVWQTGKRWRCTHKERCVRCVVWCAIKTQVVCQYRHFYVRLFRGSNLCAADTPSINCCSKHTHTHTHTHTPRLYILCVCDTTLPRYAKLIFKNRASYI
jgi:hypothetical protein